MVAGTQAANELTAGLTAHQGHARTRLRVLENPPVTEVFASFILETLLDVRFLDLDRVFLFVSTGPSIAKDGIATGLVRWPLQRCVIEIEHPCFPELHDHWGYRFVDLDFALTKAHEDRIAALAWLGCLPDRAISGMRVAVEEAHDGSPGID